MTFVETSALEEATAQIDHADFGADEETWGAPIRTAGFMGLRFYEGLFRLSHKKMYSTPLRQPGTLISTIDQYLKEARAESLGALTELSVALTPIRSAESIQDLASVARASQLNDIAEQIEQLVEDLQADQEIAKVDIRALQHAIAFAADYRNLRAPEIGVRRSGLADLSWHIPPDGVLSVHFDPSGAMTFATNAPGEESFLRERISGTTMDPQIVNCVFERLLKLSDGKQIPQ